MEPAGPGEREQPDQTSTGYSRAEVYRLLAAGARPPDEQELEARARRTNPYYLEQLGGATISRWRSQPPSSNPGLQRYNVFVEFARYSAEYGDEASNLRVYNMVRRTLETTAPLEGGGLGAELRGARNWQEFNEIVFGSDEPELTVSDETLHEQSSVYEWHGQPIELTLGSRSRPEENAEQEPDLRLYRIDEESGTKRWFLDSPAGYDFVPAGGMTIGRAMNTRGFERIREQLNNDPTVSREHLHLVPQPDGRIVVADLSTNGTRIQEQYWRRRQRPPARAES